MSWLVSVIVPTKNSADTIEMCLKSIKDQTYKNIEIIIVDKFSSDGTLKNLKNYDTKVIVGPYNKPAARNIGITESKGEVLFFADVDFIFENTLVEEIVSIFQRELCDAIFVSEEYKGRGFIRACRNLEKRSYQGIDVIEAPRVYKKWLVSKLMFDEANEGPDEYDFYFNALKLGIKTCRAKSKIYLLERPLNIRKKFSHGKFFGYYRKKHEGEENIRKQVSMGFRLDLIRRTFNSSPVEAFGLFIFKSLEYFSFSLGITAGYFDRNIQRLTISPKEEFNCVGADYETSMYHGSLGNEYIDSIERKKVLEILKEHLNGGRIKVLDIGAGNGRWSREFLKLNYDVTALDISEKMCEYLRNNSEGLKVICGGIESAKIDESFDLAFSFRNFKYVRDMELALMNIKNSLKNDGLLVIEMPNRNNPFYLLPYMFAPIVYALTRGRVGKYFILTNMISERKFKSMLENADFTLIDKERLLLFPHKFYTIIKNKHVLNLVSTIDKCFSNLISRSTIFISKKGR